METIEFIAVGTMLILSGILGYIMGTVCGYRRGLREGGTLMVRVLVKFGALAPNWIGFGEDSAGK